MGGEVAVLTMTESIYSLPSASRPWTLNELLAGWDIRYFSYARRALARGLQSLGIGNGDSVLLPSFICRDLLSAITATGATPVFYDVADNFAPSDSPEDWPRAKAVIAVNYFGFVQDLTPFISYANAAQALIIEDNAHGLFSRDENGTLLGLRGDLGLFSLRKTLALGNGAALVSRSEEKRDIGPQDPFEPVGGKTSLKTLFRSASGVIGPRGSLALLNAFRTFRSTPGPDPDDERVLPAPKFPDATLSEPLTLADEKSEHDRRRKLYLRCSELLSPAGFKPLFASLPEKTVPYAFPFRCNKERIGAADRILASEGLCTLPWPDLPDATVAVAPPHYKNVRLVHFSW